jgi:stage III sporulation protein AE
MKQICTWSLGIITSVFVGFVTIRSTAATTLDQVTLKTTKYAIDNFIPVIGKALSDAITTVAGYSLILKDAISIGGLIVMIFICVFPLIKIILISLTYKFVGAVMEPIVDKRIVECLTSAGNSLTIVFSSVLAVGVMFFILITLIASTGKLVMATG